MSRRNQLKQEAAQLRGDIDRCTSLIHRRINGLMHQTMTLARSPAALPVAFASGVLAERIGVSGIKHAHQLITSLAGQVKAGQIISGYIRSSIL
ncbi:hypothetical protein [Saccharospirillum sp.]|uniref:hypothetical protein n=1 Tax=Saccharospirillum sp. TaxID=2033801 RepID=UPI0034A03FBF